MYNNKKTQQFPDGEFTCYYFANGNNVTLITKKIEDKYCCDLSWNFGNYQKKPDIGVNKIAEKGSKNLIKLKELYNLYNSLKKHKNKSPEKQLLISALMIVIHDVKEQTYINQKLF